MCVVFPNTSSGLLIREVKIMNGYVDDEFLTEDEYDEWLEDNEDDPPYPILVDEDEDF